MGYYSGVSPQLRDKATTWLVGEPSKIVRRGVAVVGTLTGLSLAAVRAARILSRRP